MKKQRKHKQMVHVEKRFVLDIQMQQNVYNDNFLLMKMNVLKLEVKLKYGLWTI